MSDEDFEELWAKKVTGVEVNKEFEERIERKLAQFAEDYDIDDLKINDKLVLRALAQALITLDDLESYSYRERIGGIDFDKILSMEKVNAVMTSLRRDISNMQNDLKITRKVRKGDKEENFINYFEDLKQKAKEFYREKMAYVFCPKCKMLLGTFWVRSNEEPKNRLVLYCDRTLSDGNKCGEKITVNIKELYDKRGTNIEEVPEYFK